MLRLSPGTGPCMPWQSPGDAKVTTQLVFPRGRSVLLGARGQLNQHRDSAACSKIEVSPGLALCNILTTGKSSGSELSLGKPRKVSYNQV